jgi:hypothetical protein
MAAEKWAFGANLEEVEISRVLARNVAGTNKLLPLRGRRIR